MLEIDPFEGPSVKANEQIVGIVDNYLARVAAVEASLRKKRLEKADALMAIDRLLCEKAALPWYLNTFWYGPGRQMCNGLANLQDTVDRCAADIDKEHDYINSTLPAERDKDIAQSMVLAGDYRYCVIEDAFQALMALRDTLTGVMSASKRFFDHPAGLTALSGKVDEAFDRASGSIMKLREAIRLSALDFALGCYVRDGVISAADTLSRDKFNLYSENSNSQWLDGLGACLECLQGLSKEYVRLHYIDAREQIKQRVVAS